MRPTTAVTRIDAGKGVLRPWKHIAEVGPEVSGVGEYIATLSLADEPQEGPVYVLDLGSTAGGLGAVRVNDGQPKASTRRTPSSTSPRSYAPATTR